MRPLDGSLLLLACLGFAGCAYGSDVDAVVGGSPIVADDAAPDAFSGETPDSAKGDDSSSPPDDSSLPPDDVIETPDTARPEPDSSPSTCTLTLPTGDPTCDSCLETSCCSVDNACGSDPACMMFDECISECEFPDGGLDPDAGPPSADAGECISVCETEYPTGATELENLDSCLEGTCATACGAL
jgi:hypothetical protein